MLHIVLALVLVAAISGIAFAASQASVDKRAPVTVEASSGQAAPAPYQYHGSNMPFHRPFEFGLGCFGPLLALVLLFLEMKSFRMVMWGPGRGWGYYHGPRGRHWEGGVLSMFDEWHKRGYKIPAGSGEQPEEKAESDIVPVGEAGRGPRISFTLPA